MKPQKKKITKENTVIPIVFAFDTNYVIPAAVTFYSLLEHANKSYKYAFHVLHSDITNIQQERLKETIKSFGEIVTLEFIDMKNKFQEEWNQTKSKGHFSKEIIYKLALASIFPKYDKIILTDVDVVFLGDISAPYLDISEDTKNYIYGIKPVGKILNYMNIYDKSFSEEEIKKFSDICGGYLVYNLKKIRNDNKEKEYLEYFKNNNYRLNQPEQDTLNICNYPNIGYLDLPSLICSYVWDLYKDEEDYKNDVNFTKKEIIYAMNNPIQLHYATSIKPWKNVDCTMSAEWFKYIVKTPFLEEYLKSLPEVIYKIEKHNKKYKRQKYEGRISRSLHYLKKHPFFLFDYKYYIMMKNKLVKKISK